MLVQRDMDGYLYPLHATLTHAGYEELFEPPMLFIVSRLHEQTRAGSARLYRCRMLDAQGQGIGSVLTLGEDEVVLYPSRSRTRGAPAGAGGDGRGEGGQEDAGASPKHLMPKVGQA